MTKLVAIRVRERRDELILDGMTQSPRGTKVIATSVRFSIKDLDKDARKLKVRQEVERIYPKELSLG